jgi:hypothetical protein
LNALRRPKLPSIFADVPGFLSGVANYIASEGIGAYHPGTVTLIGLREDFLQLVKFLNKTAWGRPWRYFYLPRTNCITESSWRFQGTMLAGTG